MTEEGLREQIGQPPRFDSTAARGLPYYGGLKTSYPHHWSSFQNMHSRPASIAECFARDVDGFIAFILYLGAVPNGMEKPTIGRIDHDKGYEPGNFQWQECSDNSRDARERKPRDPTKARTAYVEKIRTDPEFRENVRERAARHLNDGPNRSRHNRWHIKRGIRKPGCPFCEEE